MMTRFDFRNLPDGFEFPLTRREIRAFVKSSAAHFETVEFAGLSSSEGRYASERPDRAHFVCYLRARWHGDEWVFFLQVNGVRPERYGGRREEVARELLVQIRRWADAKLALPLTAPHKPGRAMVSFNLTEQPIITLSEPNWY